MSGAPSPSNSPSGSPSPGAAAEQGIAAASAASVSQAEWVTDQPRRYLSQLCKHFAHKLPVRLDETSGEINFPDGACTARVTAADRLTLRVTAAPEALASLESVIERHLARFAFREAPRLTWIRRI